MIDKRCGTYAGYRVHLRKKQKACQPCLDATNAKSAAWAKANRQKVRDYQRQWEADNRPRLRILKARRASKRRALELNNQHQFYTEQQVLDMYGTCCYLCDKEIDLTAPRQSGAQGWETSLHIDHLVPISKGGSDSLDNVRPTHGQCNLKKGSQMLTKIGKTNDES